MTIFTNTTYTPSYAEKAWEAAKPMGTSIGSGALVVGALSDLYVRKANDQLGEPNAPIRAHFTREGAVKALKTAANLGGKAGGIVGTQLVAGDYVINPAVKAVMNRAIPKEAMSKDARELTEKTIGATIIGIASSPALHVFTSAGANQNIRQAAKTFTPKIAARYGLQEGPFLLGMQAGKIMSTKLKKEYGDQPWIDPVSDGVSGFAGGLASHPANTINQRAGAGLTTHPRMWFKGGGKRAVASAIVSIGYNALTRKIPNNTA